MEVVLLVAVLAALVAFLVLQPLRTRTTEEESADPRADLEASKEAKYREIKDAELDFQMGKIDEADWHTLDAELRAQAIEILKQLDDLGPSNEQRATSN